MHPDLSKAPGAISYAQASTFRPLNIVPATERPRLSGVAGTTQGSLDKHKGGRLLLWPFEPPFLQNAGPDGRSMARSRTGTKTRAPFPSLALQAVSEPAEAAESHASKSAEASKEAAGEAKEVSEIKLPHLVLHAAPCMPYHACVQRRACARSLCKPPSLLGQPGATSMLGCPLKTA